MKIGIIQGRLSEPIEGFQECPKNWEREFKLLNKLKLNHIEWIITKESFNNNPIFTENLSNYPISSICADNLVDSNTTARYTNVIFLKKNLKPICDVAVKNNIKCITIPLLEESSVLDDSRRSFFIEEISKYKEMYPNLIFSFEIESYEYVIDEIINICDNFKLTYDTGNMTSLGINHEYYIEKYINKINNIHLKDRTYTSKTVSPGKGKTNFNEIFNTLNLKKYKGLYTIQTSRGEFGKEKQTIKKHKEKFKKLYDEKFI